MRRLLAVSVLALGALAGCSGGSGGDGDGEKAAPTVDQFCGALQDFQADFASADPSADLTAYVSTLKGAATRLDNVGTPDAMPADAQGGFTITIDRITALPDAATNDDLAGISDVSAEEKKQLDALDDYIKDACPGLSGNG